MRGMLKRETMKQNTRRAAYHEAGHTLYALDHPEEFHVHTVWIERNGAGCLRATDAPGTMNSRRRARAMCVELLAGQEAEREFLGNADPGSNDDRDRVEARLCEAPPRQCRRPFDSGWWNAYDDHEAEAADYVAENRHGIEALARALLRHRRLSGRDAARIVKQARTVDQGD